MSIVVQGTGGMSKPKLEIQMQIQMQIYGSLRVGNLIKIELSQPGV